MARGRLRSELRESVTLLRAETWLFVGVALAWVAYGGWVLATGVLVARFPALERTVLATLADRSVSLRTVLAAGLWLVVPSLAAVALVNRRLRNGYGNLVDAYRFDHPSLLLALPGCVLVGCLLLGVTLGQPRPLTALALFGTAHLVVRTVAYGHRVYTLSYPPLFSFLVFVTALSFATYWLVAAAGASGVPSTLSPWLTRAGVGPVAETVLRLTTVGPARATTVFVAGPGVLASVYLLAQLLAGAVVRLRAPLANPQRRPDQRFPVMPPAAGPRDGDANSERSGESEPASRDHPESGSDTVATESDADKPGHTGTRVFSPEEVARTSPPATDSAGSSDAATGSEATPDSESEPDPEATDGAWLDDTAVFTPEKRDTGMSYCSECGESLPSDADACPSCGTPVGG
ncbi:zinc-ribbon domain-containing protein [Haloarcula brevis]|uniref:zinc-ribbon domain-containing protein n=1 Tax=Haloarcula brevis TaxID=3111453 RepID=UPI00300F01E6